MADPADCSFQLKLTSTEKYTTSCDIATAKLAAMSVSYTSEAGEKGSVAIIKVGERIMNSYQFITKEEAAEKDKIFSSELVSTIKEAGYPSSADVKQMNKPMALLLMVILMTYSSMVYVPMAAMLVELFPTRIRYTALSFPFHIGSGWFGGMLPPLTFAMVTYFGNIYVGLWYPVGIAAAAFAIGMVLLPETNRMDMYSGD